MTPCDLSVFEQELPTHLPIVTPFRCTPPASQALDKGRDHDGEERFLHVFGAFGTKVKRSGHAEEVVEFARGVGVDGKLAGGGLSVHGDEIGVPATYDNDLRGCKKGVERF